MFWIIPDVVGSMQTGSIVASVAISCLLNSVWNFFKDTTTDCPVQDTNSSQVYDLRLQILKNEKAITETLRGNITALEAKVINTRETTLVECQKVAQNSTQTNKTQMLALQEMHAKQLEHIADTENRLRVKDTIIASIEKKLTYLEDEIIKLTTDSSNGEPQKGEDTWFLIPFAQQSQAYLPVTLFMLSLGEFVLILLVCLPRRVKPIPPSPLVKTEPDKNGKPKRQGKDK